MAEKDIMEGLSFSQRMNFIFWGIRRRIKYFDFVRDGMAHKFAYKRAKNLKRHEL